MNESIKEESWGKEFDDKFPKLWYAPDYVEYSFQEGEACTKSIKDFISRLLSHRNNVLREKVEKMKKYVEIDEYFSGYNKALYDILSIINEQ